MTTAEDYLLARETLAEALGAVTDSEALVLIWVLQGYNFTDCARFLGASQQAASQTFYRALTRIRAKRDAVERYARQ